MPDPATNGAAAPTRAQIRASFVGRQSEFQQLKDAFEDAAIGQGALIMLVGEPGIGKTALCEQLCRFASAAGGLSLVGHCYEEGSFRPPYQPFVEVLASYLQDCGPDAALAELGSGAADLARMVPMLRERLRVTPPPPGDPEEDRWRLLQAATDFLRSAAANQPLLLVLEDLHDADRGTLDLLLYIARNVHSTRILVVGTYRDVEVDRAHPLSAALSELHRASNVGRMQLRGLSTDEVQRLLAETSRQTIPQPFAELVQRQTEGNPLFVQETLRFVIDAGLVERRDGSLRRVGTQSLAGRIPEGLRDAVGKRLSRLSDGTNRVLSVASVIGREFQWDIMRQVLRLPEEELEAALAEASGAAIIEERFGVGAAVSYRFSHAFFRQVLYEEMVAPRRIRLHQQVARVLEEVYAGRLEEHAAELAEHFAFSSETSDLVKAVHYGELAARNATDMFAYGEAARQLERALAVQDVADADDNAKRCDLLLALGESLWPAGETVRVLTRVAPEAFGLAQALGDRSRASRACQLALDTFVLQDANAAGGLPEFVAWVERAREYGTRDSVEGIKADLALAHVMSNESRWHEVRSLRKSALVRARQLGNAEVLFSSAFWIMNLSAPQHWDEWLQLVEESRAWPRQAVSGRTLGAFLWVSGLKMLADGKRVRAEELWLEVEELAARTQVATVRLLALQSQAILAVVDGRLEHTLELLRRYGERADTLGASGRGRLFSLLMLYTPLLHLGRAQAWLTLLDEYSQLVGPAFARSPDGTVLRAMCLAESGRLEEGRALVAPVLDDAQACFGEDELPMEHLYAWLQAAVVFEHRAAAGALLQRVASVAHLAMSYWAFPGSIARHLGDAAALLSDRRAACAYYAQALETAGEIRFRPELALTHLRLAETLFGETDESVRAEALEHLNSAIPELRDMNMRPALERALVLHEKRVSARVRAHARQSASDILTAREREIASLLAKGLSNHEIAQQLVIAEATVEVHVKHILSKLDFKSRSQVAGWFGRQHDEGRGDNPT